MESRPNLQKTQIILTKHAKERAKESGLSFKKLYGMIRFGQYEKVRFSEKERKYKDEKHGSNQNVFYVRNGTFIFTLKHVENTFKKGTMILLVITLCDQQQTLISARISTEFNAL